VEANYSLDDLEGRAAAARAAHRDYLEGLAARYVERCRWRQERRIIPLGICGMGRAGKDTAAEFLCGHTEMVYPRSASWMALPLVAHMAGVAVERAWAERHQHRSFWINACHAIRGKEYDLLVRMCLGAGDIAVGIRGRLELDEAVRSGVVGLTLWIDNPRVPVDHTVEYGPEDCDLVVPNHGSRLELYARLHKLLRLLHGGAFTQVR
jgi:hypothetical protein